MTGLFSDWDIELDLAARVLDLCRAQSLKLATAESCTGGLIAGCLTSIAGSSEVFTRGLVVYDNAAKVDLLGVDAALFDAVGAVSEEVARTMAEGALVHPGVDIAIADTGIAGPGGGTALKPVGRVHLACARTGRETRHLGRDYGTIGRAQVRTVAVQDALRLILEQLD
jgi:nicotinamide-nucleotide amidase